MRTQMEQYFEKQLSTEPYLTPEKFVRLMENRANCDDLEWFVATGHEFLDKVGKAKLLYYAVSKPGQVEIFSVWSDELDTLGSLAFDRMSNTLPVFNKVE